MRQLMGISCLCAFIACAAIPAHAELLAGLSGPNLITVDTSAPGLILSTAAITGLQPDETITSIDFRPATQQLYGIGTTSRLYLLDLHTGAAQAVAAFTPALAGSSFGMDFNPTVDRIRVTSNTGQNFRLVPNTAAALTDLALAYASGDPNAGQAPTVTASAYSNNLAGSTATSLYGIDSNLDILVLQNPPNTGALNTVGALGVDASNANGFDISGETGLAYAVFASGSDASNLYAIDLNTGAATLYGTIGDGLQLNGLSVVPPAPPVVPHERITALYNDNTFFQFYADAPTQRSTPETLAGLQTGDELTSIDYRATDGQLYGVGSALNFYSINGISGAATLINPLGVSIMGNSSGFDWNPVVDRFRLVTDFGFNGRINPATGAATVDTPLSYAVGDLHEGAFPAVTAVAYSNNYFGATATTLYGIDAALDTLVVLNPPNSGIVNTVGPLGVQLDIYSSLDISGKSGVAYLTGYVSGSTQARIYSVDLATGAAQFISQVGGAGLVIAVSVAPQSAYIGNDTDHVISLSELLRIIQFYNSGGYHCTDTTSEDGYEPGQGANHFCDAYAEDYNPQDWRISLGELLRLIQFFNSSGYHFCPADLTEDNYCPGL